MRPLRTAMSVEMQKAMASRVYPATSMFAVLGVAVLAGALVGAARAGNEEVIAQLGPLGTEDGWPLLTGTAAQITAVGNMLACGVVLSWTFAREFTEGTMTGLFALPVSRATIATAKLMVYAAWVVLVAIALTVLVLGAGLALDLGPIDAGVVAQLARQLLLTVLAGLIVVPAAWAATLGRGLLPGIAATLAILIAGQVGAIALAEHAAWLPFAAHALWAVQPEAVHAGQLAAVLVLPACFAVLTSLAWNRIQLDR
ncbi:MAG TPA: ABC transporter permease [Beutenbergiaceae bacterium]|nr:ABC transporter permease [Beutenbergiaceae bacterium]